jgi:hypothetical protein
MDSTNITAFDLLAKVDSFYTTSWNHLLIYGSVLFTVIGIFVGVVVPVLLQRYNVRVLKLEEQEVISRLKGVLKEEYEQYKLDLELRINDLARNFQNKFYETKAHSFHNQGNGSLGDEDIAGAADSFVVAIENYALAGEEFNIRGVLKILLEECLPRLNREDFESEIYFRQNYENMMNALNEANINDRFTHSIYAIERAFEKLQNG